MQKISDVFQYISSQGNAVGVLELSLEVVGGVVTGLSAVQIHIHREEQRATDMQGYPRLSSRQGSPNTIFSDRVCLMLS